MCEARPTKLSIVRKKGVDRASYPFWRMEDTHRFN